MSVPCAGSFRHRIAGRIDDIGVVAGAAGHGVVAGAAVEHVVAAVAGQRVVEGVAGGVDGAGAGQRQVLDVGAERVADARLHRVGAFACSFGHGIAGRIHHIGVVAGAAAHGVVAGAAVEGVVARTTVQRIVAAEARDRIFLAGAGQHVISGSTDNGRRIDW